MSGDMGQQLVLARYVEIVGIGDRLIFEPGQQDRFVLGGKPRIHARVRIMIRIFVRPVVAEDRTVVDIVIRRVQGLKVRGWG